MLFPQSVNFTSLMTSAAGTAVRSEGMHCPFMTILTDKFLHENMSGMAARFIHGKSALGGLIPMTLHAGFPGRRSTMRLGGLSSRREYELDKKHVLLDQTETVAVLADDIAVRAQFPGCVRFTHEMTTVAEFLALLNIMIESERKNDAKCRYDKQKRNKYRLLLRAQPLLEFVYYFVDEFEHELPKADPFTVSDIPLSGSRSAQRLF